MNKFISNPYIESTPIIDKCSLTPYGYEETTPANCPGGELPSANRPLFGWGTESCDFDHHEENPVEQDVYNRCQSKYIFWVRVKKDCYLAYGCSGDPHHLVAN